MFQTQLSANKAYDIAMRDGPSIELEKIILTSVGWSYHYAKDVLKRRWPKAEAEILTDSFWWKRYKENIIKDEISAEIIKSIYEVIKNNV